jgi:hypothetical protein
VSERCWMIHSNIQTADLSILHDALQKIDENLAWYSNPHNTGFLPFPMLYIYLPRDRFSLT